MSQIKSSKDSKDASKTIDKSIMNAPDSSIEKVDPKSAEITEIKSKESSLTKSKPSTEVKSKISAENKKVNAKEKIEKAIKSAGDAAKKEVEQTNKTIQKAAKTATTKTRKVANDTKKITEAVIKSKAEDTAKAVKNTSEKLAKDSKKATKKAKETVKKKIAIAKEEAEKIASEAALKTTKTTSKAKKAIKDTANKVSAKIQEIDLEREFNERLNSRYDELKWLYMELYDNMDSLNDLKNNLRNIYFYRDNDLKKIDREREKNPNWYKDNKLVGMTVYADLFSNDLNGISDKIDYFKEMNVNYLHIMPIFKTPYGMSDGGFSISDFRNVSEHLGGNDAFNKLALKCRKNGINISMDFVLNHTSDQHEWAMKAKQGDPEYIEYYNFYSDYTIPSEFEKTIPQKLPNVAPGNFTYIECLNKHVMTTFNRYQWDLNFKNPAVFNEMIYNLLYLANIGCDVLKLDSVQYIWKQLQTDCRNLPQVHSIIRLIRLITEIVCPGVILSADIEDMDAQYKNVYFGSNEKPECQMLYNEGTMLAVWNSLATRDTRILKNELSKIYNNEGNGYYVNYLRNYKDIEWNLDSDEVRKIGFDPYMHNKFLSEFFSGNFRDSFARGELYNSDPFSGVSGICGTTASLCGLEKALYERDETQTDVSINRILMLYAFNNSISGIPVICSGDEIGQLNDYTYKEDDNRSIDTNNIYKGKFNWESADKRKDSNTVESKIFSGIKKLEDLRVKYNVFSGDGKTKLIDLDDISVLAFMRNLEDENLICVFNFSEWDKNINLNLDGKYKDIITEATYNLKDELNVKPYGVLWLYKKS